jgi:hypothetical protein
MTFNQVLKHYKTVANVAKELAITHQAVYGWKKKGKIPANAQDKIETDTDGKLKAAKPVRARVKS